MKVKKTAAGIPIGYKHYETEFDLICDTEDPPCGFAIEMSAMQNFPNRSFSVKSNAILPINVDCDEDLTNCNIKIGTTFNNSNVKLVKYQNISANQDDSSVSNHMIGSQRSTQLAMSTRREFVGPSVELASPNSAIQSPEFLVSRKKPNSIFPALQ